MTYTYIIQSSSTLKPQPYILEAKTHLKKAKEQPDSVLSYFMLQYVGYNMDVLYCFSC